MKEFTPDYQNLVDAAWNREARRLPLYEHKIDPVVMEQVTGKRFAHLYEGDDADLREFFRHYCNFYRDMGYDTVSYEELIGSAMPGAGALGSHIEGVIQSWEDFNAYPWAEIPDRFFAQYGRFYKALGGALPAGMRAVGGLGYGIFECVQDLVGYESLCYLREDEPELYAALFQKIGDNNLAMWRRFLAEFGDSFCVCRFGDDLGFNTSTLLPGEDIRAHIIPQYRRIIAEVHNAGKPFLLHSCGCIFSVMEDLIAAGINAKHSNEDGIARFWVWAEEYGDRIGNFGGIDTDAVCQLDRPAMREYITEVIAKSRGHGGFAFGSGNSIPDYVPWQNYVNMNEIIREIRGG